MGTRETGMEVMIYHAEFKMPLGNPRGCIQETSCDKRLDLWREVGSRNL